MTRTESHHRPPPLEEMVAYLDGELSEVESAQVERRLSTDETYRCQMQSFDRVWSALDELPGVTAADSFSKTTMELVVDVAEKEVHQQTEALPRLRRNRTMVNSLLLVAAVTLGYLGTYKVRHDPNEMLIADLPVIEQVDIYSQFQSIDFLRQLQIALGDEDWMAAVQSNPLEPNEPLHQQSLFEPNLSTVDRRRWIDQRTPDHLLTLRAKYNRFQAFTPDHQQRLRQLHDELINAKDSAQLQRTMSQYQQWLNGQPSSQWFELREKLKDQGIQAVVRSIRESQKKVELKLTDKQISKMMKIIQPRMREIRDRTHAKMSDDDRRHLKSLDSRKRWPAELRWIRDNPAAATVVFRDAIVEQLTDQQRDQFQKLSRQEKMRHFSYWMRSGRLQNTNHSRRTVVSEQDLEEYFAEELSVAQKVELLTLPREAMRKQLKQRYWGVESKPPYDRRTDRRPGSGDRHLRDSRPDPHRRHPPRDGFHPPDRGSHDWGPRGRGPRDAPR